MILRGSKTLKVFLRWCEHQWQMFCTGQFPRRDHDSSQWIRNMTLLNECEKQWKSLFDVKISKHVTVNFYPWCKRWYNRFKLLLYYVSNLVPKMYVLCSMRADQISWERGTMLYYWMRELWCNIINLVISIIVIRDIFCMIAQFENQGWEFHLPYLFVLNMTQKTWRV